MRFNLPLRSGCCFDVVGMGLNSVDFLAVVPQFPAPDSKTKILRYAKEGGGQIATAMVALRRWGLCTKYIGKIGSDELGGFSQESIRRESVDVSSITTEPDALNQFAMILVDRLSGERTILWDRDERLMYRQGELRKEVVCSGRFLHLDGHDLPAALQCVRWAKEEGIPVMIDLDKVEPRTPELIHDINFVITSARFPTLFTGISDRERALVELQKHTAGFVCATLGREGAMALVEGNIIYAGGFNVTAIDTTGAGDVFHAGFIYGLLRNWDAREILRFANAAAALKCRELGGRKGIPSLQEIQRLLDAPN